MRHARWIGNWIKIAISPSWCPSTSGTVVGCQRRSFGSTGEGKLLFNPLRLRQGAPESHPPGGGYLQTISFDRLRAEWNPIVGVVRRFVPFRENNERSDNTPRPRLENRPALSNEQLFHLPRPPLSTYSFRQVEFVSSTSTVASEFLRYRAARFCSRFLLFEKIDGYLQTFLAKEVKNARMI